MHGAGTESPSVPPSRLCRLHHPPHDRRQAQPASKRQLADILGPGERHQPQPRPRGGPHTGHSSGAELATRIRRRARCNLMAQDRPHVTAHGPRCAIDARHTGHRRRRSARTRSASRAIRLSQCGQFHGGEPAPGVENRTEHRPHLEIRTGSPNRVAIPPPLNCRPGSTPGSSASETRTDPPLFQKTARRRFRLRIAYLCTGNQFVTSRPGGTGPSSVKGACMGATPFPPDDPKRLLRPPRGPRTSGAGHEAPSEPRIGAIASADGGWDIRNRGRSGGRGRRARGRIQAWRGVPAGMVTRVPSPGQGR